MNATTTRAGVTLAALASSLVVSAAQAQDFSIPWYTIDGGGGTSSGGPFTLSGTIGQSDAGGPMSGGGGQFEVVGGFWGADFSDPCLADFNNDGSVNTIDVLAFLNAWSANDPSGDFNGDGMINTIDVLAFLNAWSAGC